MLDRKLYSRSFFGGILLLHLCAIPAFPQNAADAIAKLQHIAQQETIKESHLELALAVECIFEPQLDRHFIVNQIRKMAKQVREEAGVESSRKDELAALRKVIFQTHGFHIPKTPPPIINGGDKILNTYLMNRFVKTRKAWCEGLCMLYLLVADEAKLPVDICNAPLHVYCEFKLGQKTVCVECTQHGSICPTAVMHRINGAKPAAAKSDVYFKPLTKRQFLSLKLNSLAYGQMTRRKGPAPLTIKQMVQIAELIEKLDPDHPESLETAALIHFKAKNAKRALQIINHAIAKAREFGTPGFIMHHYLAMREQYERASHRKAWRDGASPLAF